MSLRKGPAAIQMRWEEGGPSFDPHVLMLSRAQCREGINRTWGPLLSLAATLHHCLPTPSALLGARLPLTYWLCTGRAGNFILNLVSSLHPTQLLNQSLGRLVTSRKFSKTMASQRSSPTFWNTGWRC